MLLFNCSNMTLLILLISLLFTDKYDTYKIKASFIVRGPIFSEQNSTNNVVW